MIRIKYFQLLSDNMPKQDGCTRVQPVLTTGNGIIELGKCTFGYFPSERFWNSYCHIEARTCDSKVVVGNGVFLNNDAVLVAERTSIIIGDDCLIGPSVKIYDSDFHNINPESRRAGNHRCAPIQIERNVFIGAGVLILKGTTIGECSVIAAGSVVTKSIPSYCVAAGNPARIIRHFGKLEVQ
jgi:acetyltransferase-like isoleucine patch superfamily enzyme